jgi:hypothetical protein
MYFCSNYMAWKLHLCSTILCLDSTGKHTFVTWKLICVSYVYLDAEFKYVIKTALSPTVLLWQNFLEGSLSKFGFYCHATSMF